MIPKGAIICFILGVVGGGVIGFYFLGIANQTPVLVYENGPSLTILPDKINYHKGEPVHIKIINSGTLPLEFSDSSYGLKIIGLDGTIIYQPISAQVISTLEPKETKTFIWNQTKSDGSKIFEGRYKIVSNTLPVDDHSIVKSITINIAGS